VVFKTLATKQYAPVREFRRRVRLALEKQGLLPGDPNRVFHSFMDKTASGLVQPATEAATGADPTTLKPQDGNPFSAS
jgi:small conductance mechanosensitive channel